MIDLEVVRLKYEESFTVLNLHLRQPSKEEDFLLMRWWMDLCESGDMDKIIPPDQQRLGVFMQIFEPPAIMLYSLSPTNRIDFAYWLRDPQPLDSTTFVGLWLSKAIRATKRGLRLVQTAYALAFEFYERLMGITWQQSLLQLHVRLGYDVIGNIPNYFGKDVVYLVHINKTRYLKGRFARLGVN